MKKNIYETLLENIKDKVSEEEYRLLKPVLELQIGQKVDYGIDTIGDASVPNGTISYGYAECPMCGCSLDMDLQGGYCPVCGQSLDWGEYEY